MTVAVFYSGSQDLAEETGALLRYNRRRSAERAVQREKKRKRRVKYIQILQESAAKRKLQEQENLRLYQSRLAKRDLFHGQRESALFYMDDNQNIY